MLKKPPYKHRMREIVIRMPGMSAEIDAETVLWRKWYSLMYRSWSLVVMRGILSSVVSSCWHRSHRRKVVLRWLKCLATSVCDSLPWSRLIVMFRIAALDLGITFPRRCQLDYCVRKEVTEFVYQQYQLTNYPWIVRANPTDFFSSLLNVSTWVPGFHKLDWIKCRNR